MNIQAIALGGGGLRCFSSFFVRFFEVGLFFHLIRLVAFLGGEYCILSASSWSVTVERKRDKRCGISLALSIGPPLCLCLCSTRLNSRHERKK